MPALQARYQRRALVLHVHVAQGEELVGGRTRHWVHENREVARLRQSSLAAVARVHRQQRADAVVVRCLQEGEPHVGVPWQVLEEAPSLAADTAEDATRGTSRAMKLPQARGEHCCCATGSWAEKARIGPLVQHGAGWARKTSPGILSSRAVRLDTRQETQQHVAQGHQSPRRRSTRAFA